MNHKEKIYVVGFIKDTLIATLGIFTDIESANRARNRWENTSDIEFEFYINEMVLNTDDLLENPQRYLSEDEIESVKDIIEEGKIDVIDKKIDIIIDSK
jgi:hypothetical protein